MIRSVSAHERVLERGEDRDNAWEVCRRIADDVARLAHEEGATYGPAEDAAEPDGNLCGGWAGMTLFLEAAAKAFGSANYAAAGDAARAKAIAAVARQGMSIGLFTGVTGVAWGVHLATVRRRAGAVNAADPESDPCVEIDAFLLRCMRDDVGWVPFDVMGGASGIALYAADRVTTTGSQMLVDACLDRLESSGDRLAEGMAWRVPLTPESPAYLRETFRDGMYPLGAAHGVASVVGALAQVVRRIPDHPKARNILGDAVDFLLRCRLPDRDRWTFPRLANSHARWPNHGEMSWCWGDPGIAGCLMTVGSACGDRNLIQIAVDMMRGLSALVPVESSNTDACLCHGWAGVGHIFSRFYMATGEPAFAEAARRWFRMAISEARHDEHIGRMRFFTTTQQLTGRWQEHPGLLNGAVGVGLALLTALGVEAPSEWDRILGIAFWPSGAAA